jgi:hypothetical protein
VILFALLCIWIFIGFAIFTWVPWEAYCEVKLNGLRFYWYSYILLFLFGPISWYILYKLYKLLSFDVRMRSK